MSNVADQIKVDDLDSQPKKLQSKPMSIFQAIGNHMKVDISSNEASSKRSSAMTNRPEILQAIAGHMIHQD